MLLSIGEYIGRLDDGAHAEGVCSVDINRLVESRAILQAASGFGKSYLLCELIEATHGHIQQIIIDPEGEFSPLRKNYDFVIGAANNGDTQTHPRTAGLLATRLLETKASAILDIYDVKPRERHEFVRNFIEALMNASKDLWHPVLVILDEAHLFCPEKWFGESEATEAVIDLAARGRKRGFTLVAATQRIGKFNKNALAELHNKFIGSASLDIDVKRAAFELGMQAKDALTALRKLKPGEFYAFGPALISREPALFKGYLPKTKLPKAGHRKLVAPPKPTAAIKALLPKLADIPAEVEQKAKTEADLRRELATANDEIARLKRAEKYSIAPALPNPQKVKKPNYKDAHRLAKNFTQEFEIMMRSLGGELKRDVATLVHEWEKKLFHQVNHDGANMLEKIKAKIEEDPVEKDPPFKMVTRHVKPGPKLDYKITEELVTDSLEEIPGPQQKVLDAVGWMAAATQKHAVTQTAAAFLAGYTPGSSSFRNPRSALVANGYLRYSGSDLELTEKGVHQAARPFEQPTSAQIIAKVMGLLDGPPQKLLKELIDVYPQGMTQDHHAENCGYAPGSSSYRNPRSKLSALGLLRYEGDMVYAEKWLFLE
jgi:hypothetical protein